MSGHAGEKSGHRSIFLDEYVKETTKDEEKKGSDESVTTQANDSSGSESDGTVGPSRRKDVHRHCEDDIVGHSERSSKRDLSNGDEYMDYFYDGGNPGELPSLDDFTKELDDLTISSESTNKKRPSDDTAREGPALKVPRTKKPVKNPGTGDRANRYKPPR